MSPIGIGEGRPAPAGPLLGSELAAAIELLTDKQLRAYQYRREGHAWNWIAGRLDVTRPRVIHLVAAAEKRLGYARTVTPKQKAAYKSETQREAERQSAWDLYAEQALQEMPKQDRDRLLRMLKTAKTPEEFEQRLRKRQRQLENERRRFERQWRSGDDQSSAVGEHEAAFAAEMEATFGYHPKTGAILTSRDLVEDDGDGHDRL